MARTSYPHSANSQFFICFDDARFLDNQYTVWGRVERDGICRCAAGRRTAARAGQDRQSDGRLSDGAGRADHRRLGRPGGRFRPAAQRQGLQLVLAARRKDRLDALAAELGNARAVEIDLCEVGAADRLVADVAAHGEHVDLLINNAGFGLTGRFAELDGKRQRQMIDLNCGALVELAHAVLPG